MVSKEQVDLIILAQPNQLIPSFIFYDLFY